MTVVKKNNDKFKGRFSSHNHTNWAKCGPRNAYLRPLFLNYAVVTTSQMHFRSDNSVCDLQSSLQNQLT